MQNYMQNIAQKSSTYSKRNDQHAYGWPDYFTETTHIEYTDWVCGLGSNLIGWQNNYSCHHEKESELAGKLLKLIPFCDKIKFLKTGSAACEAAIRIARAYTGKKKVLGSGYHGCANVFIAAESPGSGCVDEGYIKFDNDLDLLRNIDEETAAVIVEPVQLKWNIGRMHLLQKLREKCTKTNTLLIFDEIITGFRVPNYFVSNFWDIQPDLITGGKALGNGYPLAFVAGKAEWMEGDYFISNTHNGELSAIKEALCTLGQINTTNLIKLWKAGDLLTHEINESTKLQGFKLVGYPTRAEWQGNTENFTAYCEIMAKNGHLIGKAWFLNFNITERQSESFIKNTEEAIKQIRIGYKLKGSIPQPIFKRN